MSRNGPIGYDELELNCYKQSSKLPIMENVVELDRFLFCCYILKKANHLSDKAVEKLIDGEIDTIWQGYIFNVIASDMCFVNVRDVLWVEKIDLEYCNKLISKMPIAYKQLFNIMVNEYLLENLNSVLEK